MILIGFGLRKLKYMTHEATLPFNSLLIHVALPCMIIGSVANVDVDAIRSQLGPTFLLAFLEFVGLLLISFAVNAILRTPKEQRPVYNFMSVCTNTGFVVLPILQAAYGDQTVVLSGIFVLMCNLFLGSIGVAILESAQSGDYSIRNIKIGLKTLWNAPLVSCVAALALLFSGIELPAVAQTTLSMMGGVCTPLAMIIVGIVLADESLWNIFANWRMYLYILIRQLAIPALLAVLLAPFIADDLVLATFVIMFAAPAGAMVQAFAQMYDQDMSLAACGTVLTTLACIPIFPILITLLSVL